MLRQRVITAVVLLVLLGAVLGSGSAIAFVLTLAIFFGAACWEALKLSGMRFALPLALMSAAVLLPIISRATGEWIPLASVCMVVITFFSGLAFWLARECWIARRFVQLALSYCVARLFYIDSRLVAALGSFSFVGNGDGVGR
jgi:CDP-diglyceride synthetase